MPVKPSEVIRFIGRNAKRVAVSILGFVVLAAGLVMLVLPGPGILVVALGFFILGTEYAWAAAALARTKRMAEQTGRVVKTGAGRAAKGAGGLVRSAGRGFGGAPDPVPPAEPTAGLSGEGSSAAAGEDE